MYGVKEPKKKELSDKQKKYLFEQHFKEAEDYYGRNSYKLALNCYDKVMITK